MPKELTQYQVKRRLERLRDIAAADHARLQAVRRDLQDLADSYTINLADGLELIASHLAEYCEEFEAQLYLLSR